MYTANHSQPRVVVRGLSDILANTVNQRANIRSLRESHAHTEKAKDDYPNQGKRGQRKHPRQNRHHKPDKLQGQVCSHTCSLEEAPHVQHHIQDGYVSMHHKRIIIFAGWVSRPTQKMLYPVRLQRHSTRHDVSIRQWIERVQQRVQAHFDVRRGASAPLLLGSPQMTAVLKQLLHKEIQRPGQAGNRARGSRDSRRPLVPKATEHSFRRLHRHLECGLDFSPS